jgi:hypothetical protein
MIVLCGKLRQSGEVTFKENKRLKVWIEHESPRDNGPADLKLEELFLDPSEAGKLPKPGSDIALMVRPYPSGRGIAYQALGLAPLGPVKPAA